MQRFRLLCWWCFGLVLCSVVSLAQAQSNNLLANSDFENSFTGWSFSPSTAQVTFVSTAHSGAQAVALSKSNATGWVRVWQRVPVTPGLSYQLSGWILWNDSALTNAKRQVRRHESDNLPGDYVKLSAQTRSPQYQQPTTGPLTVTPTASPTAIPTTPTPTFTPTLVPSTIPTLSPTVTPTLAPSPSPTPTAPPTPTATPLPTPTPTPWPERALIISEVAWAGTLASANDEWIELYNPGNAPVDLSGWVLQAQDGSPHIALSGVVPAGGFFLLERTDDQTVADVPADLIYTGSLNNAGEVLELLDPSGAVVDRANGAGGPWPAGDAAARASMERVGLLPDGPSAWATNDGVHVNGVDAAGNPIRGTPKQPNSTSYPTLTATPTPTATPLPSTVRLNEVLSAPRDVDWDGDGTSSPADEWVELYNAGQETVDLSGWQVDDAPGGSAPYTLPPGTIIAPGGFLVLYQTQTGLRLNNSGDEVRLLGPGGEVVDTVTIPALAYDASYSRDETGNWHADWPPSPGEPNRPPPTPTPTLPPTVTPTPRATPTPLPPARLVISEVLYDGTQPGDGDEFVELFNPGDTPVLLTGWGVGDAQTRGNGEGLYRFPAGWTLAPGGTIVIARDATAFHARFGTWPDAELEPQTDTPTVPNLPRDTAWGRGRWALNNSGDEVILLDPFGRLVDAVAYRNGDFTAVGRSGHDVAALAPRSIHRLPEKTGTHLNDLLVYDEPSPGRPWQPPRAFPPPPPAPAFGEFRVYWGTLHAHSSYSDGSGPPDVAYAVARANGLHFMTVSDHSHWFTSAEWERTQEAAEAATVPGAFVALRAFEWTSREQGHLNVFLTDEVLSRETPEGDTLAEFYAWLAAHPQAVAQFNHPFAGHFDDFELYAPVRHQIKLLEVANGRGTPHNFAEAYWQALWKGWRVGAAGNLDTQTPDWGRDGELRTGLLARKLTLQALMEAITARRAFSTEDASLALALRAGNVWMGGEIEPGLTEFTILVADRDAEPLEIAIWRNGAPVFQTSLTPGKEPTARLVPLTAAPGDIFVAHAVQVDGQEAWTSPIWVRGTWTPPPVRINEVLPAPRNVDWNGDGTPSGDDEWVELYNPLGEPVSLAGWWLDDSEGGSQPYRFPLGTVISPHGYLVLHKTQTGVSLNDAGDEVRLIARDNTVVDRVAYERLPYDQSLSRDAKGNFHADWQVTPGRRNEPRPTSPPSNTTTSPFVSGNSAPEITTALRLPLSQVRQQRSGLRVVAWGVVSVPPGPLGNRTFYIQDEQAGLRVYVRQEPVPELRPGDQIEVVGTLGRYRGDLELRVTDANDVRVLARGPAPLPLAVERLEEVHVGRLVAVTGRVVRWERSRWWLEVAPGAEVEIYLYRSTGLRRPWLERGELQTVAGVVGRWEGKLQLWPVLPDHLTGGVPLLLPETGSSSP